MERLGLTESELCQVLGTDPLSILSGQADELGRLGILLALTAEAEAKVSTLTLRRWVRRGPLDELLAGDFAAFEDALATLVERGLVITRGRGGARRATRP